MKTFALLIAGALTVSSAVAAEIKVEVKKEPIQMTNAEMEQVVAGSSSYYRANVNYTCCYETYIDFYSNNYNATGNSPSKGSYRYY
jgi:hypothetical protein